MRRQAREVAFQTIFQLDVGKTDRELVLGLMAGDNGLGKADRAYLYRTVNGWTEHRAEIDQVISAFLKQEWSLERLGSAERNIMRLGALEILYMEDIPDQVAINEAVELTKVFGDVNAAGLVNGVLDRVATMEKPGEQV